jgi:RNA polymerase sigma-70 factor (ECF subfamily)
VRSAVPDPHHGEPFDAAAFAAFATVQIKRVKAWARVFDVPEHIAEDLLQDALICLWQHREIVAASKWPAWMWKATLVRKGRHLRKQSRLRAREGLFAAELLTESLLRCSPEAAMCQQQDERELLGLVDRLQPCRREVVQLYLLEEQPMDVVAATLGVPLDTAKTRWKLGLRDLRAEYLRAEAKRRFLFMKARVAAVVVVVAAWCIAVAARLFGRGAPHAGRRETPGSVTSDRSSDRRRRAAWIAPVALAGLAALAMCMSHVPTRPLQVSEVEDATASAAMLVPSFGVFLTAWAERERERADAALPAPRFGAAAARGAVSHGAVAGEVEGARNFLARASAALQQNDRATARIALDLYKVAYPENPYPAQYAAFAAAAAAP